MRVGSACPYVQIVLAAGESNTDVLGRRAPGISLFGGFPKSSVILKALDRIPPLSAFPT